MWTNISNRLAWHAKNAELELGGPKGCPVSVCVAWRRWPWFSFTSLWALKSGPWHRATCAASL